MSALRNCANFREKTRERAANFVEFRCTAHAELGRRAPRALGNTHDVGTVCGKVSAAFGGEIARCRRLEFAQDFARKRADVLQILLNFGAPCMQNLRRCAPRALHNAHDIGRVLGKVSGAFGGEIARGRRLEIAQKFARKRAKASLANFVWIRRTAHAKFGQRAPRALRNTPDVSESCCRSSAAFVTKIARRRRSKVRIENFARKRANAWQIFIY